MSFYLYISKGVKGIHKDEAGKLTTYNRVGGEFNTYDEAKEFFESHKEEMDTNKYKIMSLTELKHDRIQQKPTK